MNSGVRAFFSLHYNTLLLEYNIGKRLQQIGDNLDDLVRHIDLFGFKKDPSVPMDQRMLSHSYVDEEDVIGREGDRNKIVHKLLGAKSEKVCLFYCWDWRIRQDYSGTVDLQ